MRDFLKSERFGSWAMLAPVPLGSGRAGRSYRVSSRSRSRSPSRDLITSPQLDRLDNFRELVDDEIFRKSLRNSLVFIAFAVPLRIAGRALPRAPPAQALPRRGTYRTSAYLPTIIPDMAYALLFLWLFNPLYGPLNVFLGWLGPNPQLWLTDPDAAQAAVIIMSLFMIGEGFIVLLATRRASRPSSTSCPRWRTRSRSTSSGG